MQLVEDQSKQNVVLDAIRSIAIKSSYIQEQTRHQSHLASKPSLKQELARNAWSKATYIVTVLTILIVQKTPKIGRAHV